MSAVLHVGTANEGHMAFQMRLGVLQDCADNGIVLLPAHFADPFVCRLEALHHRPEAPFRVLWEC